LTTRPVLLYPNFLTWLQDNGTATFNPIMLLNYGKMEVYQRNVVTGKVRLLTTTKDGVWVTIDVEMKEN
jgi:hypothetical protein